jgi:hypothetical protein
MSNRRAQDERIEGTPDGVNAITAIMDVPDAPTIGTVTAGIGSASVPFTAATIGGTPTLYTATSTPGSITGTSATSPITVSGLTGGTAYTFTVTPSNSTGTGPASSSSNSVTIPDLVNGYDALAVVTLSEATSAITFSGIPNGYNHLQIRTLTRDTRDSSVVHNTYIVRYNSDVASNYSHHAFYGQSLSGSAVPDQFGSASQTGMTVYATAPAVASGIFAAQIIDIFDYADTDKYKTQRSIGGNDNNGTGMIAFMSGSWRSTSPINSITITATSANFVTYSSFALYGVK